MTLQNWILSAGVLVALALGVVGLTKSSVNTIVQSPPLGAVSGDEIQSNCLTVGAIKTCHAKVQLRAATTTPVAIPIGLITGTSTLLRVSVLQDLASTSIVTIAKAATAYATTTILGELSVTANTQPLMVLTATSTTDLNATASKYTFGPGVGSQWLVIGIAAGATTLNGPTGVVEVTWQVLTKQ